MMVLCLSREREREREYLMYIYVLDDAKLVHQESRSIVDQLLLHKELQIHPHCTIKVIISSCIRKI